MKIGYDRVIKVHPKNVSYQHNYTKLIIQLQLRAWKRMYQLVSF